MREGEGGTIKDGAVLGLAGPQQLGCRKVRLPVHGEGRKDRRHSRIYSSSRAANIGAMRCRGSPRHGLVETAARKRRCPGCPAPKRIPAKSPSQPQGGRRNLTPAGCCQAKSHPGQPRARLAKLLAAGNNGETGREHLGPGWSPHPAAALHASQRKLSGGSEGVVQSQAHRKQCPGSGEAGSGLESLRMGDKQRKTIRNN